MAKSSSKKVVKARTRPSPTKKSSNVNTVTSTTQREPRHCRKCPFRPLLSECIHTVRGRAFLELQPGSTVQQPIESIDIGLSALSPSTSMTPVLVPSSVRGCTRLELQPSVVQQPTESIDVGLPALSRLSSTIPALVPSSLNTQSTVSPNVYLMSALNSRHIQDPVTPMRPIPDYHNVLQERVTMTPSSPQGSCSVAGMTTFDSTNTSPTGPQVPSTSSKKPKALGTLGVVDGVARGRRTYPIPRSRALPKLLDGQSASKYFNIQMKDIVNRCERLAHATGAWVFFTANHSNARQDFVHYSSPKFRLEAHDAIEGITNQFDAIFDNLITTRRADGFEKQAELRRKLDDQQAELDSRDADLQELLGRLHEAEGKLKDAEMSK